MGIQRHYWLKSKKQENNNKAKKFLAEIYPQLKDDEIELLAEINDRTNLIDLARELGWDDKRIKSEL